MARKKISINEALKALQQHGVNIRIIEKEPQPQKPVVPDFIVQEEQVEKLVTARTNMTKFVKVHLHARHSIGCGGVSVKTDAGEEIHSAGVESYGPGIVQVPRELAPTLLYNDRKAVEADERMLERESREYLIVQRQNKDGQRVNVGLRTPQGFVADMNLDTIGVGNMLLIR